MACYFIAHGSTGNASQALVQMQIMYTGTKKPKKKRKRCKGLHPIDPDSKRDSTKKMMMTTYRNASMDKFIGEENLLNIVGEMNKDFIEDLGDNLHREYLEYFHNGSLESLAGLSRCMDSMSLSDIKRPELHEDRLYETENSNMWANDSKNFIIGICNGIRSLDGKTISNIPICRKKKKKISFVDYK